MKRITTILSIMVCAMVAMAQERSITYLSNEPTYSTEADEYDDEAKRWNLSIQAGASLAFGDDSWHVIDDLKNARGEAFSLSLGCKLSRILDLRLKGRYLKLYNRINLEVLDAYSEKYPEILPRDGFYGYNAIAGQLEANINVMNLVRRGDEHFFNIYLILGAGANMMRNYDVHVNLWDGTYEGLIYKVDTGTHVMPTGVVGGALDFRFCRDASFNIEFMGTFTGDKMEGVKSEEAYDVYITASAGITLFF